MYASAAEGLGILVCTPNTTDKIKREKAEKDTKTTQSYGEVLQLETGHIRAPADNFYGLKLNISMFYLLCFVQYG
jgi:hypothetical protein